MLFPDWLRISLGVALAAIAGLLTGDVFTIEDQAVKILSTAVVFITAMGIVAPKPGDLARLIPAKLAGLLSAAAAGGTYLLADASIDGTARGLLVTALGLLALFIPPPLGRVVEPADGEPAVFPPGMER